MAGDDFLYVDLLGDRTLTRNLDQMPDIVLQILAVKMKSRTQQLKAAVEANIEARLNKTHKAKEYSGSPRHLKDSVEAEVIDDGFRVEGRVYIAGNPYAFIQEEGGAIPPHMIYPNKGKVLAFIAATGKKMFATRVTHPGGVIHGEHYMKDALRDMGPQLSRDLKTSVVQGIRQKMRGL